jgi:hypothetical protein
MHYQFYQLQGESELVDTIANDESTKTKTQTYRRSIEVHTIKEAEIAAISNYPIHPCPDESPINEPIMIIEHKAQVLCEPNPDSI